jgi:O-acetyl-ADP-ribose deacetylase (regulator of RNase III)
MVTGGISCAGEVKWAASMATPTPLLPAQSAWHHHHVDCCLVLVAYMSEASVQALQHYFGDTPRVKVSHGNLLLQEGSVDTFVSPANTIGNMDGGIDLAYRDHFRWSSGRPYQEANPLQLMIDAAYGEFSELPIGEAVVVAVEPLDGGRQRTVRHLIAAPTMKTPTSLPINSRNAYLGSLAVFRKWREHRAAGSRGMRTVAMPMFGTGVGRVPSWVAAAQMWEAFVEAWSRPEPA